MRSSVWSRDSLNEPSDCARKRLKVTLFYSDNGEDCKNHDDRSRITTGIMMLICLLE
jgi:hypothetical protein